MNIRVAQVRVVPEKSKLDVNHARLMHVLDKIAPHEPDVVVTSECYLDGYVVTEEAVTAESLLDYAVDPADSPYADDVSRWAAANNAWLIFGCMRAAPEGAYNTALIFNRRGELAGTYDKTHLQKHDLKFQPGNALPVFDSDFGPFGVMICADRRWPETVRTLALQGARVIFNPTYGMHKETNLHMMRTRSYESEVFIAFTHPALSLVTGPKGEIVCQDDSDAGFSITEIDLSEVDKIRSAEYSHLKDRRPDLYAT